MTPSHRSPGPALTQAQYAALKQMIATRMPIWSTRNAQGIIGADGFRLSDQAFFHLKHEKLIRPREREFDTTYYEPTDTARLKVREYEDAMKENETNA